MKSRSTSGLLVHTMGKIAITLINLFFLIMNQILICTFFNIYFPVGYYK